MPSLSPVFADDHEDLVVFLREADLTTSGLDSETAHLWIQRDHSAAIIASTGFESSDDGQHALIRSVAVRKSARSNGLGLLLARFAMDRAVDGGASTAWLFSRRSGPFWQKLGFEIADKDELAQVLRNTAQVRLFVESGQLGREVAWSRSVP